MGADHTENNPDILGASRFALERKVAFSHLSPALQKLHEKTTLRDLKGPDPPPSLDQSALLPLCLQTVTHIHKLGCKVTQTQTAQNLFFSFLFSYLSLSLSLPLSSVSSININSCIFIKHNNSMPPPSAYLHVDLQTPTGFLSLIQSHIERRTFNNAYPWACTANRGLKAAEQLSVRISSFLTQYDPAPFTVNKTESRCCTDLASV